MCAYHHLFSLTRLFDIPLWSRSKCTISLAHNIHIVVIDVAVIVVVALTCVFCVCLSPCASVCLLQSTTPYFVFDYLQLNFCAFNGEYIGARARASAFYFFLFVRVFPLLLLLLTSDTQATVVDCRRFNWLDSARLDCMSANSIVDIDNNPLSFHSLKWEKCEINLDGNCWNAPNVPPWMGILRHEWLRWIEKFCHINGTSVKTSKEFGVCAHVFDCTRHVSAVHYMKLNSTTLQYAIECCSGFRLSPVQQRNARATDFSVIETSATDTPPLFSLFDVWPGNSNRSPETFPLWKLHFWQQLPPSPPIDRYLMKEEVYEVSFITLPLSQAARPMHEWTNGWANEYMITLSVHRQSAFGIQWRGQTRISKFRWHNAISNDCRCTYTSRCVQIKFNRLLQFKLKVQFTEQHADNASNIIWVNRNHRTLHPYSQTPCVNCRSIERRKKRNNVDEWQTGCRLVGDFPMRFTGNHRNNAGDPKLITTIQTKTVQQSKSRNEKKRISVFDEKRMLIAFAGGVFVISSLRTYLHPWTLWALCDSSNRIQCAPAEIAKKVTFRCEHTRARKAKIVYRAHGLSSASISHPLLRNPFESTAISIQMKNYPFIYVLKREKKKSLY